LLFTVSTSIAVCAAVGGFFASLILNFLVIIN